MDCLGVLTGCKMLFFCDDKNLTIFRNDKEALYDLG
jgi:hypothetical protein